MKEFLLNFASILEETDFDSLSPSTKYKEIKEWDSMTALMLIAMIDEKYNRKITGTNLKATETLEDLFKLIS